MTKERGYWWIIRIAWPVAGAAWGAWLGFGGSRALPQNADSFGTILALMFFASFAWVGFFAGMATGALVGGSTEWLLRRLGTNVAIALGIASAATAFVLWEAGEIVRVKYPGLRPPTAAQEGTSIARPPRQDPCAHPPPPNSKEEALWKAECR